MFENRTDSMVALSLSECRLSLRSDLSPIQTKCYRSSHQRSRFFDQLTNNTSFNYQIKRAL